MASKMKTFYAKKQYDGYVSEDNFQLAEEDIPVIVDGGKSIFAYYSIISPSCYRVFIVVVLLFSIEKF